MPFLQRLDEFALGWLAAIDPAKREILVASVFLVGLLAAGAAGYHFIEGWSWMDGVYMTFITLTTIGFGEVHELSPAGRFLTIGIAILGIGAVAFIDDPDVPRTEPRPLHSCAHELPQEPPEAAARRRGQGDLARRDRADRMTQVILRPQIDRFIEQVLRTGGLGLLMDEVKVEANAPIAGKSLAESNFRQQFEL